MILGETVPGASFTVGELRLPRATMGAARRVRLRHRRRDLPDDAAQPARLTRHHRHQLGRERRRGVRHRRARTRRDRGVVPRARRRPGHGGGDLPALEPRRLRRHAPHPDRHRRRGDARQRRDLHPVAGRRLGPADRDAMAHRQPERRDLGRASSHSPSRARSSSRSLLSQGRGLGMLRLGDDSAASLGVHVPRTRVLLIVSARRSAGLRHGGVRTDRVRRVHGRPDRRAHRRPRRVAAAAGRTRRRAAGARRPTWSASSPSTAATPSASSPACSARRTSSTSSSGSNRSGGSL